jgi:hypothetical protein
VIHAYNFANPLEAHDSMCEQLVYGDILGQDWDWTHGTEVGLHNVAIHCKSIDFDYNLKQLWIPPTRWAMMIRQYIDPVALDDCLMKIADRMAPPRTARNSRGIAVLRTRLVQGKGIGRNVRRRWGSCMLSLSFRRTPIPTVTLHSRTTYFGYLAMLDMAVARTFAQTCAYITGTKLEDIAFVWNLELAQFHGFRSLAWMLGDTDIRHQLDRDVDERQQFSPYAKSGNSPGYRKCLDGYARILKSDRADVLYGDESFSSFARVRKRFHTEVYGSDYSSQFIGGTRRAGNNGIFQPLPDTWVSSLTFAPLDGRDGDTSMFEDEDEDDD